MFALRSFHPNWNNTSPILPHRVLHDRPVGHHRQHPDHHPHHLPISKSLKVDHQEQDQGSVIWSEWLPSYEIIPKTVSISIFTLPSPQILHLLLLPSPSSTSSSTFSSSTSSTGHGKWFNLVSFSTSLPSTLFFHFSLSLYHTLLFSSISISFPFFWFLFHNYSLSEPLFGQNFHFPSLKCFINFCYPLSLNFLPDSFFSISSHLSSRFSHTLLLCVS